MKRAGIYAIWWFVLSVLQVEGTRTCEHAVTGNNGSISSPGYPGYYPNDQDCIWLITVEKGRYIMLNFTFLDVEFYPGHSCIDLVEVKDGDSPHSELIGKFCSGISPPRLPLYSSGNSIRVWFYSDASDQRKGFHAEYKSFPETDCGGNLTSKKGLIKSPRHGTASPYPSSIECEWTVTLDEGLFIRLWFEDINIEGKNNDDCIDWIDIWDWPPNNQTSHERVCHDTNPIFSKTNQLRLKFVTNNEGRGRGFQARYTSSLTTKCGGDFNDDFGTILSQNYPYNYPILSECIWRIEAPKNKFISLRFSEFIGVNGRSKGCEFDHIEIKDGNDEHAKSLGKFCKDNPPGVIVSSGDHMWIRFKSRLTRTPGKFSAVWLVHSRECNASLGMEDGRIADTQLTASSYSNYYPAIYGQAQQLPLSSKYGRLNGDYAWCSQAQGRQTIFREYFQVDFRNLTKLTALATQSFVHRVSTRNGHLHIDSVTSYKLEFSFDGNYWIAYSDGTVNSTSKGFTEFLGNYYTAGTVKNFLRPPIIANGIRVMPTNYASVLGHMCFRLEVYGCPYDLGCGKTLGINETSYEIKLRGHATNEKNCVYVTKPIPPSYKDQVLVWSFLLFNIPCNSGYIVMEHKSAKSKKLCGNMPDSNYIMRATEQLVMKVHLKKGSQDLGFDVSYKTESLGCGEIIYVRRNGSIASPRFPKNYGTDHNCTWILIADRTSDKIGIRFKEFDLQPRSQSSECVDYLQIKNGQLADLPVVDRYCGNTLPNEFTSQESSVRIEFYSDLNVTGKGFLLEYRYLPKERFSQLKDFRLQQIESSSYDDAPLPRQSRSTRKTMTWVLVILTASIAVWRIN